MLLICALTSALAIFGLSAMTIVPSAGAERFRGQMIFAAGGFCFVWLCMALWLRARPQPPLPRWFSPLLVVVSIFYVLGVFAFVIG
jgi:predicted membrane channel-forming protein YqfA (hemolysin III family)